MNIVMFSIALEVIQSRSREGASRRYFDVPIKIFTKQLIFKLSPAPSLPGPGSGAHGNRKIRSPKPKIKTLCHSAGNSAGVPARCRPRCVRGGVRRRSLAGRSAAAGTGAGTQLEADTRCGHIRYLDIQNQIS